ncbi:MAG: NAD-dependent epimerase/dehydratase family protein [Geobacter sp.]|nr:NAD-dependent epimerase/dehydratase family protein [Geobacter sp.]
MRVLVTGATGFVGACLARRLVETGYDLHIMTRHDSNRWRIADLAGRLTEHGCDLRDAAMVESCVAAIEPEVVCHLATYGGFATQQGGREIVEANLLGTMNLVRSCEKSGVRLIINTGSSSEYGPKNHPLQEDDLPEPVGDYGVTKLAATLFCQSEAATRGVPVVTLRLFSPYGPWDDPRRLIPYAAAALLAGEPPHLASPDSVRDYVYIDDVLDCYMMLVEGRAQPAAGIYNVGSGRQSSIGEVVAELERLAGTGIGSLWGERAAARPEPTHWVADIARARDQLGWEPQVPLHEGLARTVAWLSRHLHLYRRK